MSSKLIVKNKIVF